MKNLDFYHSFHVKLRSNTEFPSIGFRLNDLMNRLLSVSSIRGQGNHLSNQFCLKFSTLKVFSLLMFLLEKGKKFFHIDYFIF